MKSAAKKPAVILQGKKDFLGNLSGVTPGRLAQQDKMVYDGALNSYFIYGFWLDNGETFRLPVSFFEPATAVNANKPEWNLFDAKEDPKTKELIYYYTDGARVFSFVSHPTKAFVFEARILIGIDTAKEFKRLLDAWIKNSIGESATYYERILSFKA